MVDNEIFFPVRYEKSRPFINKLNPLFGRKSLKELNSNGFIMKAQNIIYDEIPASPIIPIQTSLNQVEFELQLSKELNFYYLFHNWKTNGRNIFHFSKELLTLFENTDVQDFPLEKINYPYDSLYLSLTDLDRQCGVDALGNKLFMDGVLIVKNLAKDNQIDLFMATLVKDAEPTNEWFYYNNYASVGGHWFRINFEKEKNTLRKAGFLAKAFGAGRNEQKIENTEIVFWKYIALSLNALCYLCAEPDNKVEQWSADAPKYLLDKLKTAKTKHQKDLINVDLKNKGFTRINFIGQEYKRAENLHSGKTLNTHWRRGHWRSLETKIIWIKPTIVNKEKGDPKLGHIYEA